MPIVANFAGKGVQTNFFAYRHTYFNDWSFVAFGTAAWMKL